MAKSSSKTALYVCGYRMPGCNILHQNCGTMQCRD